MNLVARVGAGFVLATSVTAGAQFGPPKNVSGTPGGSVTPTVALDGVTTQFVIWADHTDPGGNPDLDLRLRFSAFPPGGPVGPSAAIPGTTSFSEDLLPRNAVDSTGTVHVVYQGRFPNRYDIFYVSSNDGGVTWSAPFDVSANPGDSLAPAIAVDSANQLHVVWTDDTDLSGGAEVFYRKRDALGNWSTPVNVSRRPGSVSSFPDVAVTSDGRVHVVWIDTTSGVKSVFYSREATPGTFTPAKNISGELFTGPVGDTGPAIAVGPGDRLHVVWSGVASAGGADIFYQTALPPTFAFRPPRNVSNNTGLSVAPRVAADSGNQAHVVWADNTVDPDYDIFYAKVFPGGGSTSPVPVEATPGRSVLPDIFADVFDGLHVCWQDDVGSPPATNFEILCTDAPESVPPETTCSVSPPPDPSCGNFVKADPASVTLATNDNSGAVATLFFRQDGGPLQTVSPTPGCPGPNTPFATSFSHGGEGTHTIRFRAEDCDGNLEPEKLCTFKIDNRPPVSVATAASSSCQGNCPIHASDVSVSITATDPSPGSGVSAIFFDIDGGPQQVYSGPFAVTGDGVHAVTFFAVDKACNSESPQTLRFEIRRPLLVEILRPKKGALYLNDQEILGQALTFQETTIRAGETSVRLSGDSPVVIGNKLTVQAKITSPDNSPIDVATMTVDGIEVARDGTDRPSGTTYSFVLTLKFPEAKPTRVIQILAQDKPLPPIVPRKGTATRAFVEPQ